MCAAVPPGVVLTVVCMPTGESRKARQRGFTYLGLLLLVALSGGLLAAVGERTQQALHREREQELLFRGSQIRAAIEQYRQATPERSLPPSLDDLLVDTRSGRPVHHLRRRFTDPFTGRFDWVPIAAPAAPLDPGSGPGSATGPVPALAGVHSRSRLPRLLKLAGPEGAGPELADLKFVVSPDVAPAALATPATSATSATAAAP